MNSAVDNPNHPVLSALPLDLVKYLEIVVVAVWDIIPCPANLIRKIATNKNAIDDIFEKKKDEKDNNKITNSANFEMLISSIFFPTHIKRKLLNKVADAYIEPNWPWVIESSFLILELKSPKKKLCPKLEKNVKINPKKITLNFKLLNIGNKNYVL